MSVFRQKADRMPITIISLFFVLDLTVFFFVENPWFVVAWFVLGIWPKGNICAWNHHHQHCLTFRSTFLNRVLELIYGFQTGITSKGWFLHHVLGHHQNYLDQTVDESRWKTKSGETMGEFRYTLEVTFTAYYRMIRVGLGHKKHLKDFLNMFVLQFALLGLALWYNWFNALFIFAVPMLVGLLITSWATYDHHSDLDTENEYEGSRNIMDPLYNFMTGNLGYHTAHHVKHGLHWSKVPEFHASIKHLIPEKCFMKAGFPYNICTGTWKVTWFVVRPIVRLGRA